MSAAPNSRAASNPDRGRFDTEHLRFDDALGSPAEPAYAGDVRLGAAGVAAAILKGDFSLPPEFVLPRWHFSDGAFSAAIASALDGEHEQE